MAIDISQIPLAIQASNTLAMDIQNLISFLNNVQIMANAGFTINIGAPNSPLLVTVTTAEQNLLIGQYNTLKEQLVTDFAALP